MARGKTFAFVKRRIVGHLLRVVAIGDHIQGWLDGALLLDHRDARFRTGRAPDTPIPPSA